MGQSEKLLCLIPTEKGILAETLFFYDEVKEIPKEAAHPELNEAELNMAIKNLNHSCTIMSIRFVSEKL